MNRRIAVCGRTRPSFQQGRGVPVCASSLALEAGIKWLAPLEAGIPLTHHPTVGHFLASLWDVYVIRWGERKSPANGMLGSQTRFPSRINH